MENWFKEVGRPALFDALAGACDRIDNALDEELKSRIAENTRLSTELEHLKSRVSDVDQLREENRSLQREIQNLKDGSRNSRLPLAPKSVNQVSNPKRSIELGKNKLDELKFSELKEEHLKLGGNYGKLREKYSELEDAHTKLNRRLRDMTKAYNRWMDHASQLNELCQKRSRTIKKLEARLDAATAEASISFNASFSSDGSVPPEHRQPTTTSKLAEPNALNGRDLVRSNSISVESPLLWPSTNENGSGHESLRSTISTPPELTKFKNGLRFDHGRDVTLHSDGHISTQDGEEASLPPLPHDQGAALEEVLIKHEPSSDTPVVVSERCLRKRKHDYDWTGDVRAVVRVKAEEDGSDPRITNEHRQFVPHESIDFDAEGGRVDTPRKRSRINPELEDVSGLNNPWSDAENDGLDGYRDEITRLNENPKNTATKISTAHHPLSLQNKPSSALKPLDSSIVPRQRPKAYNFTKRNELPSLRRNGILSLAEDGDEDETPKTNTKKISKTGRLRHLFNNPTPTHETITPTKSVLSDRVNTSAILESQAPQRRELPFGKSGLTPFERKVEKTISPLITPETTNSRRASTNATMKQSTNRRTERRSTSGAAGNATPLRERPKSQLGINDFKINPNANEGYDFAFTDVVRNKNERASLAGCVQEGCCGQTFRLQARVQRGQTSPSDFQALLEKYLGDDAWKLSTMAKPEKEELWLDAKTQELANEHGKHRHRFHRAASPVGYWRTDFPSTQEELRDKEEAAKMARQTVEERYREAMRPGGRWLFRDE
ncbi:SAE2-domain-containing protein [Annulohypoxylon truncatum]|uniref:SAE2-domain-containing protein n=1 Tax=Annulohypoxylon truncatum TaxID=327061 RepID=UPI0020087EF6|nr:SAE2-domain-containing protein [Annulohypoxylon truncatum]KAI1207264.1 SAE2-domain-containing protein [Annulohypoxylon truncatum]